MSNIGLVAMNHGLTPKHDINCYLWSNSKHWLGPYLLASELVVGAASKLIKVNDPEDISEALFTWSEMNGPAIANKASLTSLNHVHRENGAEVVWETTKSFSHLPLTTEFEYCKCRFAEIEG